MVHGFLQSQLQLHSKANLLLLVFLKWSHDASLSSMLQLLLPFSRKSTLRGLENHNLTNVFINLNNVKSFSNINISKTFYV